MAIAYGHSPLKNYPFIHTVMVSHGAKEGNSVITRAHVLPYVGQRVVVRTHDGMVHHGILHSVTHDGIYLRTIQGTGLASDMQRNDPTSVQLLDRVGSQNAEYQQAWWPLFFLPWLALAAFWPWVWWW